jgi:20S proteasome subunit beta 6
MQSAVPSGQSGIVRPLVSVYNEKEQTSAESLGISRAFSPYTDNGGTVVAISGKNFVVIASETRLSSGYSVYTREQTKLFQLTSKTVLGSTGCWCDALTFAKVIETRVKNYLFEHNKPMSTPACAQLISTMLYYKRFFPYYISNIVAGLDEDGCGAVYSYDPVGHFERHTYRAAGSSCTLIQPFLDNLVGGKNKVGVTPGSVELSLEDTIKIVKDVFISAGERDIYVGDHVDIRVITTDGIQQMRFNLRRD